MSSADRIKIRERLRVEGRAYHASMYCVLNQPVHWIEKEIWSDHTALFDSNSYREPV